MKIQVLGCYGSEYPGYRTSSLLINGLIALDAGSMTTGLTMAQQSRIKHILLSHAHLDHILDIGFLADNIIGKIAQPVEIVGTATVIDNVMKHVLNNRIWPDFTRIPTAHNPVLKVKKIKQRVPYKIAGLTIKAVPVRHTVPTWGFLVREPGVGTIVYSGDTGPTREIWNAANKAGDLRAAFIEVSFPSRLQELADKSGHLTPRGLAAELEKIKDGDRVPVYLYHMKPLYLKEIGKEIKQLGLRNVSLLEAGKKIKIQA